jgi:hypothetical protein
MAKDHQHRFSPDELIAAASHARITRKRIETA